MKKLKTNNCRLFIDNNLHQIDKLFGGQKIKIDDSDFHYLNNVLRVKLGDLIYVFNGIDGEFSAKISEINKKDLTIKLIERTNKQQNSKNLTLAFALIKNIKIDIIATKATEMGIKTFQPLMTQHTIPDKLNTKRFKANIKEAVEQCQRNDLPNLNEVEKLENYLNNQDQNKVFILCDESLFDKKEGRALETLLKLRNDKVFKDKEIVILIGPEGGFSENEFKKMYQLKNLHQISLGTNILKSDTAIIAAIALIKEFI